MRLQRNVGGLGSCLGLTLLMTSCAERGPSIPMVTPPVKAAAPEGLIGQKSALRVLKRNLWALLSEGKAHADPQRDALSADELKSRFFRGRGPTDLVGTLLPDLDRIIQDVNDGSTLSGCLAQEPVAYTITPNGEPITMYAQCFKYTFGANETMRPFVQFGTKDGVTYIYHEDEMQKAAAIVTPEADGQYAVQAWLAMGGINGHDKENGCGAVPGYGADWDTCSYGVMALKADQAKKQVELTVAGLGFGYCGAQLKSDGINVFAAGSVDMGETCDSIQIACLSAADATTPATCTEAQQRFELKPMGRRASTRSQAAAHHAANHGQVLTTWGASQYPSPNPSPPTLPMGTPAIVLDGTTRDAVRGGLGQPTAGVTEF